MKKYSMKLPEYKAYPVLKIGSNTLKDTELLFSISGYSPIIIGKGDMMPRVWIYALIRGEVHTVVNNNKSEILPIKIEYDEDSQNLVFTFVNQMTNQNICMLSLESTQDTCIISKLDLRPLGLKIYIKDDNLIVGSMTFSQNYFSGNTFMVVE